jgi:hypothetical protein
MKTIYLSVLVQMLMKRHRLSLRATLALMAIFGGFRSNLIGGEVNLPREMAA